MYSPESRTDRTLLAQEIKDLMKRSNFTEQQRPGTHEKVFGREIPGTDGRICILVYTTVEDGLCRAAGKDAIRVCAIYRAEDGKERGIASAEKRVNRVGTVEAITDRLIERMREVWKLAKLAERCPKCNSPMFKAKSGRLCCSNLCWLAK